jgi:hypothetical protein
VWLHIVEGVQWGSLAKRFVGEVAVGDVSTKRTNLGKYTNILTSKVP